MLERRTGNDGLEDMTLLLEPATGGDLQTFTATCREVIQLKARSAGGTWSLQEIVREVLPDLYRGVDLSSPDTAYCFVTEGRVGQWKDVEAFFRKLPSVPPEDVFAALDDKTELRFGRSRPGSDTSNSFWGVGQYTARKMLRKIVDVLRERGPAKDEPEDVTCRKAWELLRGFRFDGGRTHDYLLTQIDRWLLNHGVPRDQLSPKRAHLLVELGQFARSGNALIDAKVFLKSAGLNGTPLSNWAALSRKAQAYLTGVCQRKRIDPFEDVRRSFTKSLLGNWDERTPVLVLTGESGCGKTWHGYGVLFCAIAEGDVSLPVDSRCDADRDLAEAANTFWHDVCGVSGVQALGRLRGHLEQIDPDNRDRRVTVFVDNVASSAEAKQLIERDWEGWGVRLVLTCSPDVAEGLSETIGNRGRVVAVPDYTLTELQDYISEVVGISWSEVPFDLRKTLRRPLLAKLFGDVVSFEGWRSCNEYELFECAWATLKLRGVRPFDVGMFRKLAMKVATGAMAYPWSVDDLLANSIGQDAADRLVEAGWWREANGRGYEVWHDRLLNWTVAEAFASEMRRSLRESEHCVEAVAKLLAKPVVPGGRNLTYVPLDVLWLVSSEGDRRAGLFDRLVAAYEAVLGRRATGKLLKDLLPTLGGRAVPLLLQRLREATETGALDRVNTVIQGLVATGVPEVHDHARAMLDSSDARTRRAGVRLVSLRPKADILDRLWEIHAEGVRSPAGYLWPHEQAWSLYEDTFGALKACVPLDAVWLERAVLGADPAKVPVHDLAYLVSFVNDIGLWGRCKPLLMAKVDADHERSLARCIRKFRDEDELAWLECRVGKKKDSVGSVALRALAAMAPCLALAALGRLDEHSLYLTRSWCFAALHQRLPIEVMERFTITLRAHECPWRYALVLQEREDLIDPATFDFLLDHLASRFAETALSGQPGGLSSECARGLEFINAVSRPVLLACIRRRRESSLERRIVEWMLAVGPQHGQVKEHEKHEGLDALARIGGEGFSRVLEDWLGRGDWFARMHALELARRRASPRTFELLSGLAVTDEPKDESDRSVINGYAAAALAALHQWRPVLQYYLKVGLNCLTVIEDCHALIDPPLHDELPPEVLTALREEGDLTPGAILCVAFANRRDLLPAIRRALEHADTDSETAGAGLVALEWLRDDDPSAVSLVVRHLGGRYRHHAINAILARRDEAAMKELADDLRRNPDMSLAFILANSPSGRDVGIKTLLRLAECQSSFRWQSGLSKVARKLDTVLFREFANCPNILALSEEVGYGPYEASKIPGEKAAALRILGIRDPEPSVRLALERLKDPETPDGESYVQVVSALCPSEAAKHFLAALLLNPPGRVVQAIGRELGRLGATEMVRQWFHDELPAKRIAACSVVGFLPQAEEWDLEVLLLADDSNSDVSDAALVAGDSLRRARITADLLISIANELDLSHRWVLLDSLINVGDPYGGGTIPPWSEAVQKFLEPAMATHLSEQLKKRRKKLKEDLDRTDRWRR